MNAAELGRRLAQQWLAQYNAFDHALVDTGRRHNGHPVFKLPVTALRDTPFVHVYRYTPTNCEHSVLVFLPEEA